MQLTLPSLFYSMIQITLGCIVHENFRLFPSHSIMLWGSKVPKSGGKFKICSKSALSRILTTLKIHQLY